MNFFNAKIFDNFQISDLLILLFVLIFSFFMKRFVSFFIRTWVNRLPSDEKHAQKKQALISIITPLSYFFIFILVEIVVYFEYLPKFGSISLLVILNQTIRVILAFLVILIVFRVSQYIAIRLSEHVIKENPSLRQHFSPIINTVIRLFITIIISFFIVQSFGFSIGSLLAGLGIGGLAVALAAQETLSNFFSGFIILAEMPFKVNDWVKFNDIEGHIEKVNFRTTIIRSFDKTLITIPNRIFSTTPIENYSKRFMVRVKFFLHIDPLTEAKSLKPFLTSVREIISKHKKIDKKFQLSHFSEFDEKSLKILVYYFVKTDMTFESMKVREEINVKIIEQGKKFEVKFYKSKHELS